MDPTGSTMFLKIQKITNSARVDVIVNAASIMLLESDRVTVGGTTYTATRVEIAGYSKMGFHTLSTFSQLGQFINIIDVTTTPFDPATCGATSVYPRVLSPMVKTNMIVNNRSDLLEPYAFNPTHLISAEELSYFDAATSSQKLALMITLQNTDPRKVMTKLTLNDLATILDAQAVPHP